ncbi:Esa1p-associated factor [Rhizophlyctis rosea]|uniref:Chromatin modification-related protein EAF3 n=1 Tax=Rhizophlyctis rosea TaxID=64517 RepID=A0AAD5SEB7_9FUNG|nr:Esa1p-associated factor [Rhizophlyctis rosea]
MTNTSLFDLAYDEGEKILCFHGPLLYEAKVLKAEHWKDRPDEQTGPHYFVHYKGWKQTWDEWVPESRVLKFNEENLRRQKDLQATASTQKNKQKASDSSKRPSDASTDRTKKRVRDSLTEPEDEYIRRPEIKIPIPHDLKELMVADWENITKNQQLVSLPRDPTVDKILSDFREHMKGIINKKVQKGTDSTEGPHMEDTLNEVINGLTAYFDKALGRLLLYRFERNQYVDIKNKYPGKKMSEIYGIEHLTRLFVQLPRLLSRTKMDHDAINILKDYFTMFLTFADENKEAYFLKEYDTAPPAYIASLRTRDM